MLWCWATSSHRLFSLACTEEKSERYLWAVAVVKPARGMTIRFLDSATARLLEADRLCSALLQSALHRLFTRTERRSVSIMVCYMSLCQFILLCKFSILSEIAVALLFVFCLNLKSGFVKRIFPTSMLVVSLLREKFRYLTLNLNVSCDLIRTFWNITSCTGILSLFFYQFL